MKELLLRGYIKAKCYLSSFKSQMSEEKGEANIIAIILIIVVVIGLAALFRTQITNIVNNLFNGINKSVGSDFGATTSKP